MATENDAHVSETLPWYVNGTLAPERRTQVDGHLRGCARCRAELEWLMRLRVDVQGSMPAPQGDLGLSRFLDRIASESNVVPLRRPARPRWMLPAMALAAGILVAQGIVIGVMVHERSQTLQTLSGPPAARGTLLQVTFVPTATEAQIRGAVTAAGAEIVAGPGALGIYTLSVAPERLGAATRSLEEARGIVASVSRAPQ